MSRLYDRVEKLEEPKAPGRLELRIIALEKAVALLEARNAVTAHVTPRYQSNAEKQKAYRERRKHG